MKLFTKDIDKKLFAQFEQGSDLENQMVVAKIFNPYGRGVWYIINSDPSDPDYLWAIVDLFEVEAGSVSRSELESIKVPPFRLPLERDMYFTPINASELYRGLLSGKIYAEGGEISIEAQNKDMLLNYAEELEHHVEEFEQAAKKSEKVMPWVIAKIERSSTDLSDVTHYLASENEKRREYGNGEGEEEYADGGETDSDEIVYIEFLNAKKGFSKDKKYFRGETAYNDAVKWGRKNIGNFNMDMVKFEMAMGGIIEHGLKTGDKIISGKIIGTTIIVRNENHDEHAKVDLNTGERKILFYDKKTKKWIPKMADGGMTDSMSTVNEIARLSGVRPIAIAEWGDKNNINLTFVLKDLKSKKIKGMDIMTAIVGNPNNKYQKELSAKYSKMAMGGKVKFADKVKSIKKSLLERKKVSPKVRKDYGKTYSPKEAEESAKRIVGAMTAKERLMAKRKKSKK